MRFKTKRNNSENIEENIVKEVLEDFKIRQQERKCFDGKWQLNLNYYLGNQYCGLNSKGEVVDEFKQYFWEERGVFNHIAPLIELRLSKLSRVRPALTVLPFSDDQADINCAKVSKEILKSVSGALNVSSIIKQATLWSEICGTSFYKIGWSNSMGRTLAIEDGKEIKEGDVEIAVVSPFEIYPDSNSYSNIEDCNSIIYARALHKETVKNLWGWILMVRI